MPYNILIADAYPLMAEGQKTFFSSISDLIVQDICLHYEQLITALQATEKPNLIFLDANLGKYKAPELCTKIKSIVPTAKIILLGTEEDPVAIKKYFQSGIQGYLLRSASTDDLLQALESVLNGKTFVDEKLQKIFSSHALGIFQRKKNGSSLTKREAEIVRLIIEEYTNKEIANKLYIELCTVETHRHNIIQKLGVKNTAGLVRVALQSRLYQVVLP